MSIKFSGRTCGPDQAEFRETAAPVIGEAFSAEVKGGVIRSVSERDGTIRAHREFALSIGHGQAVHVLVSRDYDERFDSPGSDLSFFSGGGVEYIVMHKFAGHRYYLNAEDRSLQGAVQSVRRAQKGVYRSEDAPRTA